MAHRLGALAAYQAIRCKVAGGWAVVLVYHRVSASPPPWFPGAVHPDDFERAMGFLRERTHVVPLAWLVSRIGRGESLAGYSCVTFDDGYRDNYDEAFPVLKRCGIPATLFVSTDYVGSGDLFWECRLRYAVWNTRRETVAIPGVPRLRVDTAEARVASMSLVEGYLLDMRPRQREVRVLELLELLDVEIPSDLPRTVVLSWEQLGEMATCGASIGSHTCSHALLPRIPLSERERELVESRGRIQDALGIDCSLFAYPNGEYASQTVELVRAAGYRGAVTAEPRLIGGSGMGPFLVGRVSAGPDYSTFRASVAGLGADIASVDSGLRRCLCGLRGQREEGCGNGG